jgi:peptide/nickel transport system substrate-binding protein
LPTSVTLSFAAPAYTQLFAISRVLIVPQHVWSKVANPSTYANPKPIGSGPYVLSSTTAQAMTFDKNPHYWQAGLPKVQTVRVTDYTSQNAGLNALSAGQIDWATFFISNPKAMWFSKDPTNNKLWLVPEGDWWLCPNTTVAPLNNAAVRRALALTIDRTKTIPEVDNSFAQPSTNPTGLRVGQQDYLPAAYAHQTLTYDPSAARKALLAAGLRSGSGGTLTLADGKPFKLTLTLPSDYTDWMSMGQVFVNQMKAAGIDASVNGVSSNAWTNDAATGQYQLTFCGMWNTDSPYTTYNTLLNSSLTAPVGKSAVSNYVRWNNPATDAALAAYRRTNDPAAQRDAIQKVATIVAQQAPIIPLMSVSSYGQYSTKRFTGFPSASNPFQTDAILNPWTEDVIVHLTPAS